jgi:hypothetical protein
MRVRFSPVSAIVLVSLMGATYAQEPKAPKTAAATPQVLWQFDAGG